MSKPEQDSPFAQFNFLVDFGDGRQGGFQEMSGLDEGLPAIEYRTSRNPGFSALKMPGIAAPHLVTLKRGVIAGGVGLRDWHSAVLLGRIERHTIRISLRDERQRSVATWTLAGALPTNFVGGVAGDDLLVESIEIACDSIAAAQG